MMRLLLILLIITSFSERINGQTGFEHIPFQNHNRFLDSEGGFNHIAVGGSKLTCFSGILSLYDLEGQLKWEVEPYLCGYCSIFDVEWDINGNIIAGGTHSAGSDVQTIYDGPTLVKVDTLGNTLDYVEFSAYSDLSATTPSTVLALPDESYRIGHKNKLYSVTADFDTLPRVKIAEDDYEWIIAMELLKDDYLAILTSYNLYITDWNGIPINQLPIDGDAKSMTVLGDSVLVATSDRFYIFNQESEMIESVFNTGAIDQLYSQNDSVYMAHTSGVYRWLGANDWQNIYEARTLRPVRQVAYVNEDQVYFIGNDVYHSGYQLSYIASVALSEGITSEELTDIGVLSVMSTGVISENVEYKGMGLYYLSVRAGVEIEIYNYGLDTVFQAVVVSEKLGNNFCVEYRNFYHLDDLNLAPSDSHIILDTLTFGTYSNDSIPQFKQERCYFTVAPNHSFDSDFSNNQACGEVINDVPIIEKKINGITIFPNPTQGKLHIETVDDEYIQKLSCFNMNGELMKRWSFNTKQAIIDIHDLSSGTYILQVQTDDTVSNHRIVHSD